MGLNLEYAYVYPALYSQGFNKMSLTFLKLDYCFMVSFKED